LTLTFLVAAMLVTPAAAATPQVEIEAANSQPKPNDAFVEVPTSSLAMARVWRR